jgi:hypothetical protein
MTMNQGTTPEPFRLMVADNFHCMDKDESYEQGTYPTLGAAIEAAQQIVEQHLLRGYAPGVTATELWDRYRHFGEDPYLAPHQSTRALSTPVFSAWTYAKQRCEEICAPTQLSLPFAPRPSAPTPASRAWVKRLIEKLQIG